MAGRRPIVYSFAADTRGIATGVRAGVAGLERMKESMQEVDRVADRLDGREIDVKANESGMTALRARLLAMRAEIDRDLEINPEVDVFKAMSDIRRIDGALRRLDRTVEVDIDQNRVRTGLAAFAGSLGGDLTPGFAKSFQAAISSGLNAAGAGGASGPVGLAALGIGSLIAVQIAAAVGPGIVGGIAGAGGLVASKGLLSLLDQYDQLQKARLKADVVFRDEMNRIRQWAAEMSTSVGLGKDELIALAAYQQDILVPKGFNRRDAADITKIIVERGAAIAEFQGEDAQAGINAINSALLGQTRALKSRGVEISATMAEERELLIFNRGYWIDYGADGVKSADDVKHSIKGMNDEQMRAVAIVELLQEKSTDAWTAFNKGAGTADDILDFVNSSIANLKTDAIEGFGRIFVGVLEDIRAVSNIDLSFSDGGLTKWIKRNESDIRDAFYGIATAIVYSAKGLIEFIDLTIKSIPILLDAASAMFTLAQGWAAFGAARAVANNDQGALDNAKELFQWASDGKTTVDSLKKTAEDIDFGNWKESANEWLDNILTGIDKAQQFSNTKFEIRAAVKKGDFVKAETLLDGLTKRQVKEILADTKGSDKKVDKQLRELAKSRLAEIKVEIKNESETERRILTLTKDRTIWIQYKDKATGQTLQRPDNTPIGTQSVAPSTVIQINDGRLADYIGANVNGQAATVRRTEVRRYGYI